MSRVYLGHDDQWLFSLFTAMPDFPPSDTESEEEEKGEESVESKEESNIDEASGSTNQEDKVS